MEADDHLEFQHLAGGNIVNNPPIFAPNGEHIFFINDAVVNVYSTVSCQLVRKLEGATSSLVDFQLDIKDDESLVACSTNGEILSWHWPTGKLRNSATLQHMHGGTVRNFKLLNLFGKTDLCYGFVFLKKAQEGIKWRVVERTTGATVPVMCELKLIMRKIPLVAIDTNNFPTLVICVGFYVFFVNYKKWNWKRFINPRRVPITAVQIHPTEECVATGDEMGKIFLWRHFYDQHTLVTSLYHWHHTMVTSIAFTPSGTHFYSSGCEAVLVKWLMDQPLNKHFLPRMGARILHVVVNADNTQIAVCTADNGVQLVGSEKKIHANLQEFTYIPDDKTEKNKFPVGLRLNPRLNTLALNGRTGSLQFYNTHTRNLLHNMSVINENLLSMERNNILYDTRVTKAAFNIDWMATGEEFNDEEHFPELRLKFWQYLEATQNYCLNTSIELPHEGGFKAIAFSNDYQIDDLLCVTAGEDNIIKMWSLEGSDNICKASKTWYCIARTSYKNLILSSVSFSQDGSLLAAGYGNTLCIYKSDNLKLKAALSSTKGLDGCVAKAQVKVPTNHYPMAKTEPKHEGKQLMEMFSNMLDANEESLQNIIKLRNKQNRNTNTHSLHSLDEEQKKVLFRKILKLHQLNLFQKILLYQKLGIHCKVPPQMQAKLKQYVQGTLRKHSTTRQACSLNNHLHRMNIKERFTAKYRLQQFSKRKRQYDENVTEQLIPLFNILSMQPVIGSATLTTEQTPQKENESNVRQKAVPPQPALAAINHVQFAAGEYAHLVVVCTERRILVWNVLTLRLQSFLKLSVQHVAFDPQTNLMAVVTKSHELHVFQPHEPMPIYQRNNIPNLYGMAWIPRRYPKHSINVDWQAQSTLYFLTEDQEIQFLCSPNDKADDNVVVFQNEPAPLVRYTTFGTFATKSVSDKDTTIKQQTGPLILGNSSKTAVKTFIEMSTHTMPPMMLLCEEFIKAQLKKVDNDCTVLNSTSTLTNEHDNDSTTIYTNGDIEMNGGPEYTDSDDEDNKSPSKHNNIDATQLRHELLKKSEELNQKRSNPPQQSVAAVSEEESILNLLANYHIELDF